MGLSLKKDEMIKFLQEIKADGETFSCMLWGVCYAKLPIFENRSTASIIMLFSLRPGVAGTIDNAFCYIGITQKSLYVIALDAYNTSKVISSFAVPFTSINSLKMKKGMTGSYTVDVESEGNIRLVVKSTSLGTDIKDQKERLTGFVVQIEALQESLA